MKRIFFCVGYTAWR